MTVEALSLSLQLKKLNANTTSQSNTNPAFGHKEVPRPTGHIVVTTRYSETMVATKKAMQQGSKSRQKKLCDSTSNGTDQQ